MQGSCASLWKSELGRNQRSDFRQPGSAILDAVFFSVKWEERRTYLAELPRARRPQATGAGADWGAAGRGQQLLGSAPPGHLGHAPAPAASQEPRLQRVANEPSQRSSQVGATGPWHRGSPPRIQDLGRGPQAGRGRAENAMPLAAGARRASPGACLSHRWAGMGGACAPSGAWEDPAPRNLPKNSLPPGRLPGLLPFPTPCGP